MAFEEVGDGEDALAKALGRVLGGQGVTVEGPFVLDGADFVGAATRGLTVGEFFSSSNLIFNINCMCVIFRTPTTERQIILRRSLPPLPILTPRPFKDPNLSFRLHPPRPN